MVRGGTRPQLRIPPLGIQTRPSASLHQKLPERSSPYPVLITFHVKFMSNKTDSNNNINYNLIFSEYLRVY